MGIVGDQSQALDQTAQPEQVGNAASQLPDTNQGEAQQQDDAAKGYVTKAELDALREEMVKIAHSSAQSSTGKLEQRIIKRMNELKAAGIPATAESVQRLIDAEEQHGDAASTAPSIPPENQGGQVAQPAPTGNQAVDPIIAKAAAWMDEDGMQNPNPITAEAYRLMAVEDIHIMDEDPEAKTIGGKTAFEFLSSLKAAVEAKRARLDLKGTPARIPGMAGGAANAGASHDGKRGIATLDAYYRGK